MARGIKGRGLTGESYRKLKVAEVKNVHEAKKEPLLILSYLFGRRSQNSFQARASRACKEIVALVLELQKKPELQKVPKLHVKYCFTCQEHVTSCVARSLMTYIRWECRCSKITRASC